MSKSHRTWRPIIFLPLLGFSALALLTGVLVLIYGIDVAAGPGKCDRFCGWGFTIRQYFGQQGYERAVAMMFFLGSYLSADTAFRAGLSAASKPKRIRPRGRKK